MLQCKNQMDFEACRGSALPPESGCALVCSSALNQMVKRHCDFVRCVRTFTSEVNYNFGIDLNEGKE